MKTKLSISKQTITNLSESKTQNVVTLWETRNVVTLWETRNINVI